MSQPIENSSSTLTSTHLKSSSSFPQFALLPHEIQDIIWQLAIAAIKPRLVELQDESRDLEEDDLPNSEQSTSPSPLQEFSKMKMQHTSCSPIPPTLHTCQRSRALSLHRWTLSLAKASPAREIYPPYLPPQNPIPRIFFDFETDILFCPDDEYTFTKFPLIYTLSEMDRGKLKYLAVDFMFLLRGTDEMLHGRRPRPGVNELGKRGMWENIFEGVKRLPGLVNLSIVLTQRAPEGAERAPVLCFRHTRPERWGGFASGMNLLKGKARAEGVELPVIDLVDVRRVGWRASEEPYAGGLTRW